MNPIDRLTELFKEFPGIGPRQAKRFVYFLLLKNQGYSDEISSLIPQLKKSISTCGSCYRYFPLEQNVTACRICSDTSRDISKLMIIARDTDIEAFEKSGVYNGHYFVLGGLLPILEENTQKFIRLNQLAKKIETINDNLQEVIIALNANPDGDNTADFLMKEIPNLLQENFTAAVSILGRGLSTGSELEYADKDTLLHALENRK